MSNRLWLVFWSGSLLVLLVACKALYDAHASKTHPGSSTSTDGSVSIISDRSVYHPNDRIQATVRNMLSIPIYALNGQAECSILSMEVQIHGSWQASSVASCLSASPVQQITINPGTVCTIPIHAGSPGVSNAPMPSGTYRLALHYWTNAAGGSSRVPSATTTVYSPTFSVQ